MDTEQSINNNLKKKFGCNLNGLQLFRVAWSDKQTELRDGEHNEFYGSLFVRTVRGISEHPKYPLIKGRWLLERWIPPDSCYTDQIVSAKGIGSYECVYVFQDANREYLPLNGRVAEIITQSLLYHGTIGKPTDSSDSAAEAADRKEHEVVEQAVKEMYEEEFRKDMKYPDGERDNKYTDGFKIFVPKEIL
jgi:hypothetical protein